MTKKGVELLVELSHCAHALERDELAKGVAPGRWAKLGVNRLDKLAPRGSAIGVLILAVPQLGVAH